VPIGVTVPSEIPMSKPSASSLASHTMAFLIECATSPLGVGAAMAMSSCTPANAEDVPRDELGLVALILPVDRTGEGHDPVVGPAVRYNAAWG
jgi:hypothetical protein